jgi:carbamoyl-phosphate synthase large subunit
MPRRTDLKSVLVIGSGPIAIGQACEFDYSGTQACSVLRAEGLRVLLINSNPATIMTDPSFADATYIEPITPEFVAKLIEKERPDALLATLGGQTALNTAVALHQSGVLAEYGVELIGVKIDSIEAGENRERFKEIVDSLPAELGAESARSVICHSIAECQLAVTKLGYPAVVRPSFTMGGAGSGIAFNDDDLRRIAGIRLAASPTAEVLLEESLLGWKEYELEAMRDQNDNVVIVCSIENHRPDGRAYRRLDHSCTCPHTDRPRIPAATRCGYRCNPGGGCGHRRLQHPVRRTSRDRQTHCHRDEPRVSRSSALASKATGFPIAKIAAKLALGYTLDEIPNDITQETFACFEPALDYVVVKVPRFAFEKFPQSDPTLTAHMKSVGEAMAIGRNFPEALQKALRSLEKRDAPFTWAGEPADPNELTLRLRAPYAERLTDIQQDIRAGVTVEELHRITQIDLWFLDYPVQLDEVAKELAAARELDFNVLRKAKRCGFSDEQIGEIRGLAAESVRRVRHELGIRPVYKTVDTCAAEFAARTPYYYSSYDDETEVVTGNKAKVIILGSGPNRIGQGIEFDYSCVHACCS